MRHETNFDFPYRLKIIHLYTDRIWILRHINREDLKSLKNWNVIAEYNGFKWEERDQYRSLKSTKKIGRKANTDMRSSLNARKWDIASGRQPQFSLLRDLSYF